MAMIARYDRHSADNERTPISNRQYYCPYCYNDMYPRQRACPKCHTSQHSKSHWYYIDRASDGGQTYSMRACTGADTHTDSPTSPSDTHGAEPGSTALGLIRRQCRRATRE
jgi:hypothetical protein